MKQKLFSMLALLLVAVSGAWAQSYTVTLKSGTEDADNWTITPKQGLSEGDVVTIQYNGTKRVKSVTATTNAEPPAPVEGKFTINANGDQVNFAKGNLQATTANNGTNWTWGFAEHQWDYVGNQAANTKINADGTTTENGTVDLFGWVGTSSNFTGAAQYGISSLKSDGNYGDQTTDQLKHDWGELIGDNSPWRVLTNTEWNYVINSRQATQIGDKSARYAKATVNGVPGLILFPDEYKHPAGVTNPTQINVYSNAAKFSDNQYDAASWTLMENAGCIFLPASGNRSGNDASMDTSFERGVYWTSTPHANKGNCSYVMRFTYSVVDSPSSMNSARYYGNAVRLVKAAE